MRLHLAATGGSKSTLQYIYDNKLPKLFSILRERNHIRDYPEDAGPLIVDSGAHSWNKLDMYPTSGMPGQSSETLPDPKTFAQDYIQYIYDHRDKPYIYVELDIYGTLPKKYIDSMWDEVSKFEGAFQFIRVYHMDKDDKNLSMLKKWLSQGQTYIGVGGYEKRIFRRIFSLTKDKIKYHGFAVTDFSNMSEFPFYSVDSTSWMRGALFGQFCEFKNGRMIAKPSLRKHVEANRTVTTPKLAMSNDDILLSGAKAYTDLAKHITELWRRRGIVWED